MRLCELCAREVGKAIGEGEESQGEWEQLLKEQKDVNTSLSASLREVSAQLEAERSLHRKEIELLRKRQKLEFGYYKRQIRLLESLLSITGTNLADNGKSSINGAGTGDFRDTETSPSSSTVTSELPQPPPPQPDSSNMK